MCLKRKSDFHGRHQNKNLCVAITDMLIKYIYLLREWIQTKQIVSVTLSGFQLIHKT